LLRSLDDAHHDVVERARQPHHVPLGLPHEVGHRDALGVHRHCFAAQDALVRRDKHLRRQLSGGGAHSSVDADGEQLGLADALRRVQHQVLAAGHARVDARELAG